MDSKSYTNLSPMQAWLSASPDSPVYRVGGTTFSRGQLLEASEAAARHLHALGFRRGDALALLVPDSATWLQFLFAASRLGVLLVPISTRYRDMEIEHVLQTSNAKGIVYLRRFLKADFEQMIEAMVARLPNLSHRIGFDGVTSFFAGSLASEEPLPTPDPSALLCTFSTSGTTGMPKLAAHTQAGIALHAETVAGLLEFNVNSRTFCALPLYGVLGFVSAMATIAGGGCCIAQPVFKAETAAQMVDEEGVTHFYGSDGLLDAVLRVPGFKFAALRRGGFAEFAGLGGKLTDFAEKQFGLNLCGIYGASECFALMALQDPNRPAAERTLPGGIPVSRTIEVRVVDTAGEKLADKVPGELQIRGPNVMALYLNNPKATAETLTVDGWLRTGDLAYTDGDGFVYLSRMKDSLRLRGYLVDPAEIESFLVTHQSVDAAQVVGVHREGRGDVAVAFVRPRLGQDYSEEELIGFCGAGISNYKVPSRIVFLEQFPEISGPNGVKIQKNKLRDLADTII
ncbi:AMP-binding protein [Rhizobium herbae]